MTTPEIQRVHELAAEGFSLREIAAKVGSSHTQVARILKKPKPAAMPALAPAPSDTSPEPVSDEPAIDVARRLLRESTRNAELAREAGNFSASQRGLRDAAGLAAIVARLERGERERDAQGQFVSPEELARAEATLAEQIAAAGARPLLCAHCSRALSLEWGGPDVVAAAGALEASK